MLARIKRYNDGSFLHNVFIPSNIISKKLQREALVSICTSRTKLYSVLNSRGKKALSPRQITFTDFSLRLAWWFRQSKHSSSYQRPRTEIHSGTRTRKINEPQLNSDIFNTPIQLLRRQIGEQENVSCFKRVNIPNWVRKTARFYYPHTWLWVWQPDLL